MPRWWHCIARTRTRRHMQAVYESNPLCCPSLRVQALATWWLVVVTNQHPPGRPSIHPSPVAPGSGWLPAAPTHRPAAARPRATPAAAPPRASWHTPAWPTRPTIRTRGTGVIIMATGRRHDEAALATFRCLLRNYGTRACSGTCMPCIESRQHCAPSGIMMQVYRCMAQVVCCSYAEGLTRRLFRSHLHPPLPLTSLASAMTLSLASGRSTSRACDGARRHACASRRHGKSFATGGCAVCVRHMHGPHAVGR